MRSERMLRAGILLLYGIALSRMLWTGEIFRYVGSALVPLEWVAGVILWILILASWISVFTRSSVQDTLDAKISGAWTTGALYAIFALPALTYLIDAGVHGWV